MTDKRSVTRRGFLGTTGAAAGAAVASGVYPHPAVGKVLGANEKLNFGIIGPGGRAQAHIGNLLNMKKEGKPIDIVAVADVWDGNDAGRARALSLGQEVRPGRPGQGRGHQGLPQASRPRGHRRRRHRHARPLARRKMSIDAIEGGQGRLLRKADDPHHRRGPTRSRRR